jgi:hypothetical protein
MSDANNGQDWSDEMDRPEHEQTYENFLAYSKWTSIVICGILLFLLVFVYN